MTDTLLALLSPLSNRLEVTTVVDVAIVALVMYWLLSLISGTSAATLVRGIFIVVAVAFGLSYFLNLTMLGFLLRSALPALLVAVPILFAPELRRALEQVGRAGVFRAHVPTVAASDKLAETVAAAAQQMSERHWGALMVIERGTALGEYAGSGTVIDGVLSVELLLNVFYPNSPLHDGAVIIHGDRLVAAGIVLPLPESATVLHMGTRHRAALGITERSDALAVVVSEETGRISIANSGRMVRNLSQSRLIKVLSILERAPGNRFPTVVGGGPGSQDGSGLAAV